ncbi:nesprin-1-like isoform X2 [Osmia bicornis bicornis]|uniref:nesprin-1-like isoform X2 n=1 Tax=Osmia bicornis bicornis TaxID=1437191 RepID=UPI001EAF3DEF|nr:nesprin-1-like isoform X2 [Osmia bicornis bicornis]
MVEVLQLRQKVFRETFQQYHRLSTRLVKTQDSVTALKLWQEYLSHVQDFLSNDVPADYSGLSEHRNLCEVLMNLLTDQQNLILTVRSEAGGNLSTTEQFNILTNLHNETLSKIIERHAAVRDMLTAWDRYKVDRSKLLGWLKEIERERSQLHLRFINLRRLDKILQRMQALLDKIPEGEAQSKSLQEQQETLLINCDGALAASIRMEHAADSQRIANLSAGLQTWRDFIQKIQKLHAEYEEQTRNISATFEEISQTLSTAFHAKAANVSRTSEQLESVRQLQNRLSNTSIDLESLGVITEQLRECLSPSDVKSLNHQRALLCQRHGDLEHQAALLACRLGERRSLYDRWVDKSRKLYVSIVNIMSNIQKHDSTWKSKDAQKRLVYELQAEIALQQRDLFWVQSTGQDLLEVADEKEKERIQRFLDRVNEKWDRLTAMSKARAIKSENFIRTMETLETLERRLNETLSIVAGIEMALRSKTPVTDQSRIDRKFQELKHYSSIIDAMSANVSEVLNLAEIFLKDSSNYVFKLDTSDILRDMYDLEKRWDKICIEVTGSEGYFKSWVRKALEKLEKITIEYEDWLRETDSVLSELENNLDRLSKEETDKAIEKAKRILEDVEGHESVIELIKWNVHKLVTYLEIDNLKSVISGTYQLIDKWATLKPRANTVLSVLQRGRKNYRDFITVHAAAVVSLTQVDVRLTRTQHLATTEQKASAQLRLQQLNEIEEELRTLNVTLQRADELALKVMQECHPDEVANIQKLVDEYQLLSTDIKERVASLRAEIEGQEKKEVDEAVQVDTLPRLLRMTSSDAYLMVLEAALIECNDALDTLELAVTPDPVAGPGLNASAKHISKLIGSCQSSIELARHLHSLLVEDGKLSPQVAKVDEVTALTNRYESLLILARTREQQIRELSDNDRLTCPLCSHRNWAQLENDLWRIEKWLEFAEGTQNEQHSPPSSIEQLEDVIQNHREFLLDLNCHKSILVGLNTVGAHLANHTEKLCRASQLKDRLTIANTRWDKVCSLAARWQGQLQVSLMSNQQFHRIIEELLSWLEKTEMSIRVSEPVDLTKSPEIMTAKYNKFRELRSDLSLERCEPRVLLLQEAVNQLLDEKGETRARLQELRLRLQSLRRLTGIYALKLGAALGMDPREIGLAATTSSLASLSQDICEETIAEHKERLA